MKEDNYLKAKDFLAAKGSTLSYNRMTPTAVAMQEYADQEIEVKQNEVIELKKILVNTHEIMKTFKDERAYEYLTHKLETINK